MLKITERSRKFVRWGTPVVFALLVLTPAQAQDILPNHPIVPPKPLAGTYRCDTIEVEGKKTRCPSPPLVLNSDGSYQLGKEQGTYRVLDKFVVLSEARKRGPGLLKKRREIVFEYYHESRKYTVTFKRVDTPPPGAVFARGPDLGHSFRSDSAVRNECPFSFCLWISGLVSRKFLLY